MAILEKAIEERIQSGLLYTGWVFRHTTAAGKTSYKKSSFYLFKTRKKFLQFADENPQLVPENLLTRETVKKKKKERQ